MGVFRPDILGVRNNDLRCSKCCEVYICLTRGVRSVLNTYGKP